MLTDTGCTAKNSMSLLRQPGPLSASVRGESTNYPFLPGKCNGMEVGWQESQIRGLWSKRGPYWWECKLLGSRSSNPGINVLDLPQGVRPISHSPEDFGDPGGVAFSGPSTDQLAWT